MNLGNWGTHEARNRRNAVVDSLPMDENSVRMRLKFWHEQKICLSESQVKKDLAAMKIFESVKE